MFNFFKKKKSADDEIWYSFFKSLYAYCEGRADYFKVNCQQYDYFLEYYILSFPDYYVYEEEIERFKKLPYQNMYQVLNILYSKANIHPVDIENAIEKNLLYDFLHIRIPIDSCESLYFKLLFVKDDNGKNTYRILYFYAEEDTLEILATKTQDMPIHFSKQSSSLEAQHFMKAMVALAKYTSIEIPKELDDRFSEITVVKPVNMGDFERIIELVNLNPYEGNIKDDAKKFYDIYLGEKPENVDFDSYEDFEDNLFIRRFELVSEANLWESDWKFDPEDAVDFINDLTLDIVLPDEYDDHWTFNYPEETYSHDLFPFIQEGLEKIGLNLMNIETFGDHYVFFLVKKDDVSEILELSEKLALGLEKV